MAPKKKKNVGNKSTSKKQKIGDSDDFKSPYKFESFYTNDKIEGKAIYATKFNPYILDRNIFATLVENYVYILECVNQDVKLETSDDEEDNKVIRNIKPLFAFEAETDKFYALSWSFDEKKQPLLAFGGEDGVLRIVVVSARKQDVQSFPHAHTGYINDMKTHPTNNLILLSGSSDYTIRMWNLRSLVCIAVFAGSAHVSEIISIDWEPTGKYFMAGGMDHVISVWHFESDQVQEAYATSFGGVLEYSTVRVYDDELRVTNLHSNYIDSVIWLDSNSFMSRSCNGEIFWWKTGSVTAPNVDLKSKNIEKLLTVKEENPPEQLQFFIRMQVDNHGQYLGVGNCLGKILLFDLESASTGLKRTTVTHPKTSARTSSLIRMISFSHDDNIMIACSDSGMVLRFDKT